LIINIIRIGNVMLLKQQSADTLIKM